MDWSDVRIFLAIARTGTLSAAARQSGQTQPTMGRRIRALEEAIGQTLFQRTADGFILTDEGSAVLAHAERMEEDALAFERSLAGKETHLTGVLRVSSSDWFGVHVLTPVFAEFLRAHPRVSIELVTDSRRLSLARRDADLLFRITPFEEADVIQRKFMHMDYALYGPADAPPPRAGTVRATDLSPWTARSVRCPTSTGYDAYCRMLTWRSAAIIATRRRRCARRARGLPSCHVRSATPRRAFSGSTWVKRRPDATYGLAITATCAVSQDCGLCLI